MNQNQALDILKSGRNVYLTGVAGSGKTHTLNEYINFLKERDVGVGVTASTGIAATHIGGVTIHSWSGIGARDELSSWEIEELEQKEYLWRRFEKTSVLVIDEVSMLTPCFFDTLDSICKKMKRSEEPFGGIQIVLSGDFFQLPPVNSGSEIDFIDQSMAWKRSDIRVCYLKEQFRHKGDELEEVLNEMRSGHVPDWVKQKLYQAKERDVSNWDVTPTRLFPHNASVDKLNERELEKLPGREEVYEMTSKGRKNIVENLKKGVLAPEKLRLKRDALVMFVKNNFDEGYVNGTLGVVKDFSEGLPIVEDLYRNRFKVEPAQWSIEEEGKTLASVQQIPLRLAWAITVHKSQGMSMDAAEVDLSEAFVPGQGYVALSRLRSLSGLLLNGFNDTALSVHPYVVELDKKLLAESAKWEKVISRFLAEDFKRMQDDFIFRCGGNINPSESVGGKKNSRKVPTHEKTAELIKEGLDLEGIAERRGLKVQTIISHLEKLKQEGFDLDLSNIKPPEEDLEGIRYIFEGEEGERLKPVYEKFNGKYSYQYLRLARIFL